MPRPLTLLFVSCAVVAVALAALFSISDNPVGISMLYVATACVMLAVVHGWRRAKHFAVLLGASAVGFPVAALMHNLLYAAGLRWPVLGPIAEPLHVGFFLVAIFVCPVGVVVGAAGLLVVWWRRRSGA
jgi:hypothetical protein